MKPLMSQATFYMGTHSLATVRTIKKTAPKWGGLR